MSKTVNQSPGQMLRHLEKLNTQAVSTVSLLSIALPMLRGSIDSDAGKKTLDMCIESVKALEAFYNNAKPTNE